MEIISKLRWYEWIGWGIDALMIAASVLFIAVSAMEGEFRPALIGGAAFLIVTGAWTGVLLFYGKEDKGDSPDGSVDHGRA